MTDEEWDAVSGDWDAIVVSIPTTACESDDVFDGLRDVMKRIGCQYLSADEDAIFVGQSADGNRLVRMQEITFTVETETDKARLIEIISASARMMGVDLLHICRRHFGDDDDTVIWRWPS